jgi:hypothetical protein
VENKELKVQKDSVVEKIMRLFEENEKLREGQNLD